MVVTSEAWKPVFVTVVRHLVTTFSSIKISTKYFFKCLNKSYSYFCGSQKATLVVVVVVVVVVISSLRVQKSLRLS